MFGITRLHITPRFKRCHWLKNGTCNSLQKSHDPPSNCGLLVGLCLAYLNYLKSKPRPGENSLLLLLMCLLTPDPVMSPHCPVAVLWRVPCVYWILSVHFWRCASVTLKMDAGCEAASKPLNAGISPTLFLVSVAWNVPLFFSGEEKWRNLSFSFSDVTSARRQHATLTAVCRSDSS